MPTIFCWGFAKIFQYQPFPTNTFVLKESYHSLGSGNVFHSQVVDTGKVQLQVTAVYPIMVEEKVLMMLLPLVGIGKQKQASKITWLKPD